MTSDGSPEVDAGLKPNRCRIDAQAGFGPTTKLATPDNTEHDLLTGTDKPGSRPTGSRPT